LKLSSSTKTSIPGFLSFVESIGKFLKTHENRRVFLGRWWKMKKGREKGGKRKELMGEFDQCT
jgi:hypothetical protein